MPSTEDARRLCGLASVSGRVWTGAERIALFDDAILKREGSDQIVSAAADNAYHRTGVEARRPIPPT